MLVSEEVDLRMVRELEGNLINLAYQDPSLVDRIIQGLHKDYIDDKVIQSVSPVRVKALAAVLERFGYKQYAQQFRAEYKENLQFMEALIELANTGKRKVAQLQQGIARGLYAKTDVDEAFSFYFHARHRYQLTA